MHGHYRHHCSVCDEVSAWQEIHSSICRNLSLNIIQNQIMKYLSFAAGLATVHFLLTVTTCAYGQQTHSPVDISIYRLDNGLTVYLNEDHALPNVFGAVAVKGGSKRDPADATGIAHYFEHIMFKGTDSIGTLDYQTEKVYLDSIVVLYDKLAETDDEAEITSYQVEINRLSIQASKYAIPNEIEKILSEMGGTQLNAGTSNEEIVYFNIFPSNQIEKWLRVYSHRFIHPVYRLFQSELETVYEEYNMYKDSRFSNAYEKYSRAFYPDHPYGVPVIGYPDHLKKPSMKKMDEYFQTYYVANNMALILSGNFITDEVKSLINRYFGGWRTGEIPPLPGNFAIQPIHGRYLVQERLTPIRFGIRSYRTVPVGHEDEPVLDVISGLLSNNAQTGLIDELVVDHKLMAAAAGSIHYLESGGEMILFVPKIIGQSLKKAERLVNDKSEDLKAGRFDEQLLEAIKTNIIVNYERNFEDQYRHGYMMIEAFVRERDWQDILEYPDKIKNITKDDIVAAVQKYYGDDYLVFYSKTGFPKKPETLKPPFDPIPSGNQERKSEYALRIEQMPVPETEPDFIEFGPPGLESNEVTVTDLNALTHLYYTENKVNGLFNLTLRFGIGTFEMPVLQQVAEYMQLIGTDEMSFRELSGNFQNRGASYNFFAGRDDFNIAITGLDSHLREILNLVADLIYTPKPDDSKIKNIHETAKAQRKVEEEDPAILGACLYMYAVYGDHSSFINRLTLKEVRGLKSDTLLAALRRATRCEVDIHYSGSLGVPEMEAILSSVLHLDSIHIKSTSPVKDDFKEYTESVVFFLNDKKAIQSKDYFFIPGNQVSEEDKPYLNAYAEYLDGGMQSIIFQEIRELRSLAYATGAKVRQPFYPDEKTSLVAYFGTQADKTREAIQVMHQVISTPPEKSDRIEMVRKSLVQSINSEKPGFRSISEPVARYYKLNYTTDPRKQWVEIYQKMNFNDIVDFYRRQFYQKPTVITIIGDKRIIGEDWMGSFGKVNEVTKKDILRN